MPHTKTLRFPCELTAPTTVQIAMHGEQVMRGNIWSAVNRLSGVQDELALLSTTVSTAWTVLSTASAAILSPSMVSMAFLLRTISATCADVLPAAASYATVLSAATVAFTAILSTTHAAASASACSTFEERSSNPACSSQSL
jgi:hypothetical protein